MHLLLPKELLFFVVFLSFSPNVHCRRELEKSWHSWRRTSKSGSKSWRPFFQDTRSSVTGNMRWAHGMCRISECWMLAVHNSCHGLFLIGSFGMFLPFHLTKRLLQQYFRLSCWACSLIPPFSVFLSPSLWWTGWEYVSNDVQSFMPSKAVVNNLLQKKRGTNGLEK